MRSRAIGITVLFLAGTCAGCVRNAFLPSTALVPPPSDRMLSALGDREDVIAKRMEQDVRALATPSGRRSGTQGHEQAHAYILSRLKELGLSPYAGDSYALPYAQGGLDFVNIAAVLPGRNVALPSLLLMAHYDTFGSKPGADDNAAAIAVLLAAAEALRSAPPERSVTFLFPDAEEPPYFMTNAMGSTWFYLHQRQGDFHCAVALDLVGHDVPIAGLEDLVFLTGIESDPGLGKAFQAVSTGSGLRLVPTLNRYIGDLSDHHIHRVNRRPYLFFSAGVWKHYHRRSDVPDRLNYAKMARFADYLTRLTHVLDGQPLTGPFEGYDTTPLELRCLRQTVGPIVNQKGIALENRRDIDRVARMLFMRLVTAR